MKGSPLTAQEGDNNFDALRDFANALETRMDAALNPDGSVKTPLVLYGASASATDEYVISVAYTAASYADLLGKVVLMKADVPNAGPTTPATLKINPLTTAIAIKRFKDQELANGDIKAGQIGVLTYDGTFFQLHNPSTLPPDNYFADDGTATAYRINLATNPVGNFAVPYAYYAGYRVRFKATNANAGAATLQVMSPGVTLAPTPLKRAGADLEPNDIAAATIVEAVHDGTNFQILSDIRRFFSALDASAFPTSSTARMFAHGFGVIPRKYEVRLKCIVDNLGYTAAAGDEVNVSSFIWRSSGTTPAITTSVDAATINVAVDGTSVPSLHPMAGGVAAAITAASWKLKVYAER